MSVMKRLEDALGFLSSLLLLAGMGALMWNTFTWTHAFLMQRGWVQGYVESATMWCVVGACCAAYWPLKYRHNMKGHWLSSVPWLAVLTVTGPWALLLGIPF